MTADKKKQLAALLKYIPIGLCLVCMIIFLHTRKNISVESILSYTPQNTFLAIGMMLLLYAGKSMSIIFPMMVLQIVGGHLFPTPLALAVNIAGMFLILALPYWVGHFSGIELIGKLMKKYPKLAMAVEHQQQECFFVTFFLRVISILPGDVVSMYFGATGTPFWTYLWGSALGTVPGVITSTLMGSALDQPDSPLFLGSLLLTILLSLLSLLVYHRYGKKRRGCER